MARSRLPVAALLGVAALLAAATGGLGAQPPPLPDRERFFAEVLKRLLDTMVRGEGPSSALLPMAILLGFALVFGLIAARLFRWED